LFATLLPLASAQALPTLFSQGFVSCLLNNLNRPDNYLHAAAADCLEQIVSYAKAPSTAPDVRLSVIAALQRLGRALQVEPMKPVLKTPETMILRNKNMINYLQMLLSIQLVPLKRLETRVGSAWIQRL